MFLQNLKNIYVSVNNNNVPNAVYYATEMRNTIYSTQYGGTHEFEQLLKKDIDPIVARLGLNKKYIDVLIQTLNYVIDYIEKLKIDDVEKLNALLKEMRVTLQTRLEREQS